jgi:hypothetical protein
MNDLREAALQLCRALDSLDIPYAICGSFASSVHGIARATQDLDVVAGITLAQAEALAELLKQSFYADIVQIRDAILQRRSFNVIHLDTAFKLDIFPASSHPLGAQEIKRRQFPTTALLGGDPVTLPVISAEDILLAKLRWYKDGDLRNILQVQGSRLDSRYLTHWAGVLDVQDLLSRLLNE